MARHTQRSGRKATLASLAGAAALVALLACSPLAPKPAEAQVFPTLFPLPTATSTQQQSPLPTPTQSSSRTEATTASSSSSSAATSSARTTATRTTSSAQARTTKVPQKNENPCEKDGEVGVCDVGEGRGTCVKLEKTKFCSAFTGFFLPTDLTAYFAAKFPTKLVTPLPKQIKNATQLDWHFAPFDPTGGTYAAPYSYMTKYEIEYMVQLAGCPYSRQKWYKTWWCLDMIDFYAKRQDPCARNAKPPVCRSFFEDRAKSIRLDTKNSTFCKQNQFLIDRGEGHVQALLKHPFISDASRCISGQDNEHEDGGDRLCGLNNAWLACKYPDVCPPQDRFLSAPTSTCETELSAAPVEAGSAYDPLDKDPSKGPMFAMIGLAATGGLALLGGLCMLNNIRRRGAKLDMEHSETKAPLAPAAAGAAAGAANARPGAASTTPSMVGSSSTTNLLGSGSVHGSHGNVAAASQPRPPMPQQQPPVQVPMQPMQQQVRPPGPPQLAGYMTAQPMYAPAPAPVPVPVPVQQPLRTGGSAAPAPGPVVRETRTATMAYQPQQADELHVVPGDTIEILARFDDGWCQGRSMTSGRSGVFPFACVQGGQVGARYASMGRGGGR